MSLLSVSTLTASREALVEGGVTVDLDATLLIQLVLFVVLIVVLKPMLFDPMMRLFEEREKRIEGTRREANKEDERSAKALAKYEGILAQARAAGATERDVLRAESARKEAELMADVRKNIASTLDRGRTSITGEAQVARQQLGAEATTLGQQIASRVLGREVSS
jgi:F-type H+-transporting ATPase subunit b